MKYLLAILTCVLVLPATRAQTVERLAAYEHLKPLVWLIGDWVGDFPLTYDVNPSIKKGDVVEYHVTFRWALDRTFIVMDGAMVKDGRRAADSHEVILWDPDRKQIRHAIYTPLGTGDGEWTEVGKKARLAWSLAGGKGVTFMESVDADTHTWQVTENVLKGEKLPDWPKVTFKRKTGAEAGDLWKAAQQVYSGTWESIGELPTNSPDGKLRKGDKFAMRIAYTPVLGGKAVTADLEFRVPARSVDSKGRGLIGWDPDSRQVRWLAYWDDGSVEEVLQGRQQGAKLFGSYIGRNPGQPTNRGPTHLDLGDDGKSAIVHLPGSPVPSTWKRVDK